MKLIDPSTLSPADLGLLLAQLLETEPQHELVLAARLALEVGDARRAAHRGLRDAALDVHSAHTPGEWRRWADQRVPHDELQRRRGVEIGPDGVRRGRRRDNRPDYPGRGAA